MIPSISQSSLFDFLNYFSEGKKILRKTNRKTHERNAAELRKQYERQDLEKQELENKIMNSKEKNQ
jgi:hypothetical protein